MRTRLVIQPGREVRKLSRRKCLSELAPGIRGFYRSRYRREALPAGGRKLTGLTVALTLSRPVKGRLVYLQLLRGAEAVGAQLSRREAEGSGGRFKLWFLEIAR